MFFFRVARCSLWILAAEGTGPVLSLNSLSAWACDGRPRALMLGGGSLLDLRSPSINFFESIPVAINPNRRMRSTTGVAATSAREDLSPTSAEALLNEVKPYYDGKTYSS